MKPVTPPVTPWYRQFWPWLLICLPGVVVIASIATWVIASRTADDEVDKDYYKVGLTINRDKGKEDQARQLGVQANLMLGEQGLIRVYLRSKNALTAEPLELFLQHPSRQAYDQRVQLKPIGPGLYEGQAQPLRAGRWYVDLSSKQWQVRGEAHYPQQGPLDLAAP
ncbi:FixH family protein [Leeia sp.]|uniref:FixH family protein n=1 Tax=Leeia sp. TaxID=2884678 RepID=UPI0035AFE581